MNTLRELLRRVRPGHTRARRRAISTLLSEELEVLASSAVVRDLGLAQVRGRRVSS